MPTSRAPTARPALQPAERRRRQRGFLLLFLLWPCAGSARPETALEPLPALDLAAAEGTAAEQLAEARAAVDALLAGDGAEPAELARAFGDLGLLYVVYDVFAGAAACFDNASLLQPDDVRWPYLSGYARSRTGDLEAAARQYARALELDPGFLPAAVRLGRAELARGRPQAARKAFERALELNSDAAAAHEGLGKAAVADGRLEDATSHFERALELDPGATGVHYALALAYRDLGRLDRARSHLERSGDVAARLEDPMIDPLATLAESAQFYLVQGAEALDDGDHPSAEAAFRQATEHDAASFPAWRGLAVARERQGDRAGARRAYERALELGSTGDAGGDRRERAGILRSLGLLEADAGRGGLALEHYLASLELVPDQPDLLLRAAGALARARRFEEAVELYDRLAALEPAWTPAILEKRATALVNLGRGDEAIADFERAVEAAPEDPRLRLRFARALDYLGDPDAAGDQRAAAERLAGAGSGRLPLVLESARQRTAAGDFTTAIRLYASALELDPEHLEARLGLAAVLGHTGRFTDAAEEYQRVIAGAPRHLPAHRGLIAARLLAGEYGRARVGLQEALAAFPRHPGLALAQVRLLASAPDDRVRDGALALEIARRLHAERQDPPVEEALALAYAAAGRLAEALDLQRALVAAAQREGNRSRAAEMRARLETIEAGHSWTASSPEEIVKALDFAPDTDAGAGAGGS